MSIVSRANGLIGLIVTDIISREPNVVLNIHKTLIRPHRILSFKLGSFVGIWKLEYNTEFERLTEKSDKTNKNVNDFSYWEILKRAGWLIGWLVLVINPYWLFNCKSCLYIFIHCVMGIVVGSGHGESSSNPGSG